MTQITNPEIQNNIETIKTVLKELIDHETSLEGKLDLLTSISIGCENDEIFQAAEAVRNDLPLSSDQIKQNQQAFSLEAGFSNGQKIGDVLHEGNGHENVSIVSATNSDINSNAEITFA